MTIIDAQIHTWYPDTPQRPWPRGATSLHGPQFLNEQAVALMDAAGVDRAILVPPRWTGFDNEYALEAVDRYPGRFAVMGRFDVQAPDARERLPDWTKRPGMLGIRIWFLGEPWMSMLQGNDYDWFWSDMARRSMPLMCAVPGNMRALHPVLERHPNLRIIIDHAGRHPQGPKDEAAWTDIEDTLAIARYPNTTIKVSSLPCFSSQPYPFPSLRKPNRAIYDAFGAKRMLWGSDATRLTWGYPENLRLFSEALDFLSASDRKWILGRAAADACGWPI